MESLKAQTTLGHRPPVEEWDAAVFDAIRNTLCKWIYKVEKSNALLQSRNEALEGALQELRDDFCTERCQMAEDFERTQEHFPVCERAAKTLASPAEPPKARKPQQGRDTTNPFVNPNAPDSVEREHPGECPVCENPLSYCACSRTAEQGVATAPQPNASPQLYSVPMGCWVALHRYHEGAVWLMKKQPDGQWITVRRATPADESSFQKLCAVTPHPTPTDEAIRAAGELCNRILRWRDLAGTPFPPNSEEWAFFCIEARQVQDRIKKLEATNDPAQ